MPPMLYTNWVFFSFGKKLQEEEEEEVKAVAEFTPPYVSESGHLEERRSLIVFTLSPSAQLLNHKITTILMRKW